MSLVGLDRLYPDIIDLASVIYKMEMEETGSFARSREDIFDREERWILAGGDCLFSEFEQRTSVKISSNESWATFLSTIYKRVYKPGKM